MGTELYILIFFFFQSPRFGQPVGDNYGDEDESHTRVNFFVEKRYKTIYLSAYPYVCCLSSLILLLQGQIQCFNVRLNRRLRMTV